MVVGHDALDVETTRDRIVSLFLTTGSAYTTFLKSVAARQCLVPTWEVVNTRVFTGYLRKFHVLNQAFSWLAS